MRYFFLLVLTLLYSCYNSPSKSYQLTDYEKMADKITAQTAIKIEKETGLRLCGVGGGAINHIRKLNMSFDYCKEISFEEGRRLLVYCVNEYLSAINSNEEIRSHLIHYPFTPKDLEIKIFIRRPDHREVAFGKLAVVSEVSGKVKYKISQPDPVVLEQIHEETYEEAVKVLEAEGSIAEGGKIILKKKFI